MSTRTTAARRSPLLVIVLDIFALQAPKRPHFDLPIPLEISLEEYFVKFNASSKYRR